MAVFYVGGFGRRRKGNPRGPHRCLRALAIEGRREYHRSIGRVSRRIYWGRQGHLKICNHINILYRDVVTDELYTPSPSSWRTVPHSLRQCMISEGRVSVIRKGLTCQQIWDVHRQPRIPIAWQDCAQDTGCCSDTDKHESKGPAHLLDQTAKGRIKYIQRYARSCSS